MKKLALALVVCLALIVPGAASADNLPRDYIPAPPGCLAVLAYYTHSSADSLFANGHRVASDVDFNGNVGLFRPVYYLEAGPFIIDPQFIIPFGNLELESTSLGADLSASGIGDPIVLATFWFLHDTKSKTWLGFTPFFFLPAGDYDNHGALSLGANRWGFREELGFVKGFEVLPGHNAYYELQLGGDFFTTNDDFTRAGLNMKQEPIFNVESHLSYDVTDAFFVSGDYYYHLGGETKVNGVFQKDQLSNHTVGFTLAYNIAPSYQALFQYKGDVDVKSGLESQAFTFRFLYACDVGFLFGKSAAGK